MSIYGGGGKCHKQIMDLAVHFHWEHLSTYTQSYWFPSNERHFSGNTCKSICVKKHLIPNVIAYLIFGPLYLAMYYTGSVNWMEVFKNICWSQKKTPKNVKTSVPTFFITWLCGGLTNIKAFTMLFLGFHSNGLPSN